MVVRSHGRSCSLQPWSHRSSMMCCRGENSRRVMRLMMQIYQLFGIRCERIKIIRMGTLLYKIKSKWCDVCWKLKLDWTGLCALQWVFLKHIPSIPISFYSILPFRNKMIGCPVSTKFVHPMNSENLKSYEKESSAVFTVFTNFSCRSLILQETPFSMMMIIPWML